MMRSLSSSLLCLIFLSFFLSTSTATTRPVRLPGQPEGDGIELFAGYTSFKERGSTTHSFHLLARREGEWKEQPLVLWLTGGPGCSSLFGAFTENGPYRLSGTNASHQTVEVHSQTWAQSASMLYVESPPGVGFSYRNDGNYTYGDDTTAESNFLFVKTFFEENEEYRHRPFFVAGESYAGHYVPQLVAKIVESNAAGHTSIPLSGMMAGNPSTDGESDSTSFVPFTSSHGLASSGQVQAVLAACNGTYRQTGSKPCVAAFTSILDSMGPVNPYDIYSKCYGQSGHGGCFTTSMLADRRREGGRGGERGGEVEVEVEYTPYGGMPSALLSASSPLPPSSHSHTHVRSQTFIPCLNNIVGPSSTYFNRDDVQLALGVKGGVGKKGEEWVACSPYLTYNQYAPSVLPLYESFIQITDLRILVYSGDVDNCVPWIATQSALDKMGLPITTPWHFWSTTSGSVARDRGERGVGKVKEGGENTAEQVAGYAKTYAKNLTYATVKGAGHLVPYFKPDAAFFMFDTFMKGGDL
uniref:Carboxypeptidase n=1 Tax=Palpitomonas bilix TaxID=652834 RepID=A0A7S3D7C7_9EUKA